jgi:hypothetical protein
MSSFRKQGVRFCSICIMCCSGFSFCTSHITVHVRDTVVTMIGTPSATITLKDMCMSRCRAVIVVALEAQMTLLPAQLYMSTAVKYRSSSRSSPGDLAVACGLFLACYESPLTVVDQHDNRPSRLEPRTACKVMWSPEGPMFECRGMSGADTEAMKARVCRRVQRRAAAKAVVDEVIADVVSQECMELVHAEVRSAAVELVETARATHDLVEAVLDAECRALAQDVAREELGCTCGGHETWPEGSVERVHQACSEVRLPAAPAAFLSTFLVPSCSGLGVRPLMCFALRILAL